MATPRDKATSLSGAALLALWLLLFTTPTPAAASAVSPCAHLEYQAVTCSSTFTDMSEADEEEGEDEEAQEEGVEITSGEGAGEDAAEEEAASAEAEAEEMAISASNFHSAGSSDASSVVLSHLKLSASTVAALQQRQLSASAIGFSFNLSAATKVKVTFVRQSAPHGREHWRTLPDSLALHLARGHVARSLTGHNKLSPGRYCLTVKPLGGRSRSIYLSAHQ